MAGTTRKTSFAILAVWLGVSVLLYYCMFGETDDFGFHNGWLFSTRPGWLWLTVAVYITTILLTYLALAFVIRKLTAL